VSLAFLFPGQGAQKVGMGRALAEAHPLARETFEEADRALGFTLSRLCWEGPADDLKKSVNTQPALLAHGVAAWRLVDAAGLTPAYVAGHSLGEYTACVAAGALTFADALHLVRERGRLMYEAGLARPGTMAAVLGLDRDKVEEACARAADVGVVVAANLNAPGQIVISGEIAAVEAACGAAKALGARRAIRLDVSGAFHSPLMAPAALGLARALAATPVSDPHCPVVANVSAAPQSTAAAVVASLDAQLLSAVRWEESMRWLAAQDVTFVELGTGTVLKGLLRSIAPDAQALHVEGPESLQATLAAVGATAPMGGEGVRP
jgi:[acyl-carrier-protein] S-malonyltransferase